MVQNEVTLKLTKDLMRHDLHPKVEHDQSSDLGVFCRRLFSKTAQTDLTSNAFGQILSEFSPVTTETPSSYSDAINSDDETFHSDAELKEAYEMPDFVAIKFSQKPRILLKGSKKTTTVTIDPKTLEDDEIKLKVSDWPIGNFNLSVGGFRVFPKRSNDLPENIIISTELRKIPSSDFSMTHTPDTGSAKREKEKKRCTASNHCHKNVKEPPTFLKCNSCNPKPETSEATTKYSKIDKHGKFYQLLEKDRKDLITLQEKVKKENICDQNFDESKNFKGKSCFFHKEERDLVCSEAQTLVHISPHSITEDQSDLTDNTRMQISEILEKSEKYSNRTVFLETLNEDTEGQMGSYDNTDQTLREISDIPYPGTYYSTETGQDKGMTDEEVPEISDHGVEIKLPSENNAKQCNDIIKLNTPYEIHLQHSEIEQTNWPEPLPRKDMAISFSDDTLNKNKVSQNGRVLDSVQATEKNIEQTDSMDKALNINTDEQMIPGAEVASSLAKIYADKKENIANLGSNALYMTYTYAKTALLRAVEVLEEEMSPLRSELTRLHCEFKNMNVGEDNLALQSGNSIASSTPMEFQATENCETNSLQLSQNRQNNFLQHCAPPQISQHSTLHQSSDYHGSYGYTAGFTQGLELYSFPETNIPINQPESQQLRTPDPTMPWLNVQQFSKPIFSRSKNLRTSLLSDPDDILRQSPPGKCDK